MEVIKDVEKLRRIVSKGAYGWQPSNTWPHLYFWNTTGKEHYLYFPTIYASKELLEKTTAKIVAPLPTKIKGTE